MSSDPLGAAHLVGLSAILWTLGADELTEAQLLDVCRAYGLRAGTVPWSASLKRAVEIRLVEPQAGMLALSDLGRELRDLLDDLEPSEPFCHAILLASLGRGNQRHLLSQARVVGASVRDPRALAAPLLEFLSSFGLLDGDGSGGYRFTNSDFDPLLIGLMLAAPRGSAVAQEVGRLGELLTLRYYRELKWQSLRVSLFSDAFGFDVLCRRSTSTGELSRAAESKASTATDNLPANVSAHEIKVARALGDRYDLVVWGGVRLSESVEENYGRLRTLGYPIVHVNPIALISASQPGLLTGLPTAAGVVAANGITLQIPAPKPQRHKEG